MNGDSIFRVAAPVIAAFCLEVDVRAEAPAPAPPAASQPRTLSPVIVETLTATLPKFAPPAPAKLPVGTPSADAGESLDDVLHLQKITVRPVTKEPPAESGWLTNKGRIELAMKLYPGLRFGNIFGLNQGMALALLEDERLARKRAAVADAVEHVTLLDSKEDKRMRHLMEAAVLRPNTDWQNGRGPGSKGP